LLLTAAPYEVVEKWLLEERETWFGLGGLGGLRSGLAPHPSRFSFRGSTRANQVPAIDKHGATPHAARDNPYVVLLPTSPRIFDLYTTLLQTMERAS
jgi:hypothetical protein